MTRRRKILIGAGAAAGVLLLALGLLLYTPPGLRQVARLVTSLSGGTVRIAGLDGFLPNHIVAARVEIADDDGVWLRVQDADLVWSALPALFGHIAIDSVRAARVQVLRRPRPSSSEGSSPVIDIAHLAVPRIELAAAVAGHGAVLSAQGAVHYASRHDLSADLAIARLDSGDRYRIQGGIAADVARGQVTIREGTDGILGALVGLPGLGPVNVTAQARGDSVNNVLSFTASAGALTAAGQGTIRLGAQRADLDFHLRSPAMAPRPGLSWRALSAEGHFHGAFDAPRIDAHLELTDGRAGGLGAARLVLDAKGVGGTADVNGVAHGVTIPGGQPDLFAHAPLTLQAHADLADGNRPVRFTLTHPLVSLEGSATTRGPMTGTAEISIPSLAAVVAGRNMDLAGSGQLRLSVRDTGGPLAVRLDGTLDAKGAALPARLLGHASLSLAAVVQGGDLLQSRLVLKGRAVSGELAGTRKKGVLAYRASLALSDLSRLAVTLRGNLSLHGTVNGPLETAALKAEGTARMALAASGNTPGRLALNLSASGLPMPGKARLALTGRLDGAPLHLLAVLASGRHLNLTARWKSLEAAADLALPGGRGAHGTARLALERLQDVAPFIGTDLSGTVAAHAALTARGKASDAAFDIRLASLAAGPVTLAALGAHGTAADLFGKPVLTLDGAADGIVAAGFTGTGKLAAHGALDDLTADLSLDLKEMDGGPALLSAGARVNANAHSLTLMALKGTWRGGTLALDGPADIAYGDGLSVQNLAAHLGGGTVAVSGSLSPALALQAKVQGVRLEDFPRLMPTVAPRGTLSADIALSGTLAAPIGHIAFKGEGLRAAATGNGTPPAVVTADIGLAGGNADIDAAIRAGTIADLTLKGRSSLAADGAMALRAQGRLDMALFDPLLAPDGRRARGVLAVDMDIAGTRAAPRLRGGAELTGGEFQDYARGVRVSALAASLRADGTRLTVTRFDGTAGPGTISGSGSVDLAAPGLPVDLRFAARNARPIVSDLVTATINGDMTLKGQVRGRLDLSGKADIVRGEINLPERFPPEVAVLNVRRRGQPPPPPPSTSRIALDMAIGASGPIFVRGHGMDAVMGGDFRLSGTTADPQISGGFRLVRGTYSLGGQTLDFDSGSVRFDGVGVRHRLDPSLDFTASTQSGGVSATLTITGYASAPKIALSSSPSLPQDEIVARLLFQQSVKQLSPLQVANIAQALAAMGGVGGGFDALGTVRRTLGLDRLAVGSASSSTATGSATQTTVEAGRYIAGGIYVGAKQNLSGGTQTQVQVDITDRLKAQATISAGTNADAASGTAPRDYGGSVGLSYQLEY